MSDVELLSRSETKLDFVPVIFANGRDDDLPGVAAGIKNERVQYEDKIYEPGESMHIYGRVLFFSVAGIRFDDENGGTALWPSRPGPGEIVRIICPDDGRFIKFDSCTFLFCGER